MKKIVLLLILFQSVICNAQEIISAEYFYDTDPGIGAGIPLSSFIPASIANINQDFPTTGLSMGSHVLYVRTMDSGGKWSLSEGRTINIVPSIIAAEYFYDTDPGVGNAIAVSPIALSDSINFNTSFPTTGLSNGSHVLYVRTKDSDGRWSLSEGRTINIIPSIKAAEYFYDTDPGVGNAAAISLSSISDSVNFMANFPTAGLSNGSHKLYVRTKDSDGRWSLSEGRTINIVTSITAAEYFYDIDPGVGNANPIYSFTFSDSVRINSYFPTTGLSNGSHVLYVRTRDTDGRWSLSEGRTINIVSSIVAAEYFYDTDPGVGNAAAITPLMSSDSINFNTTFPTDGLSNGSHVLYVRTKDTDGRWSLSEGRAINIVPSIIAAEYFYDTDPGFGSGTAIPVTLNSDSVNFNYLFPTHHLAMGSHTLYVRTKDTDGRWSLTEPKSITIQNDSAILVRLFIEGFYIGGRQLAAVIDPFAEPTICDPVTVSLIEEIPPYNTFYTQSTYLRTDGTAAISIPSGANGNSYYIKMQHRNSMETWSNLPVLINGSLINYSFTSAITQAYGNNMRDLGDGSFANFSGDISDASSGMVGVQDGIIESQDYSDMENAVNLTLLGYLPQDITGDGIVESTDYSIMENNVYFTIAVQRP